MSDAFAEEVAKERQTMPSGPPVENRSITISATLQPDGSVDFTIPKNKIVSHGLIGMLSAELAKMEVIQMLNQAKKANGAHGGMGGLMKRMNGG
jgi:hypothetical protein